VKMELRKEHPFPPNDRKQNKALKLISAEITRDPHILKYLLQRILVTLLIFLSLISLLLFFSFYNRGTGA
jgi:hypothetical protein